MYDKVIFLDFDGVINAGRMKDCVCLPIVIGTTQVVTYPKFMHRGTEIQDYLNKHKEINKYLCIDDSVEDILETIPKKNVYKTDGSIGLTVKDIKNIKRQWEEL